MCDPALKVLYESKCLYCILQCTCGAKSRKELPRTTHGFRDVGVNCPTPPALGAQTPVVAADIAVLKAGPSKEDIPHHALASTVKLTLQDAFMYSKQEFIDRSRERVKKLKQKCEERKQVKTSSQAQVVVVVPSEKTKPLGKKGKNPDERMFDVMKPSKKFGKHF